METELKNLCALEAKLNELYRDGKPVEEETKVLDKVYHKGEFVDDLQYDKLVEVITELNPEFNLPVGIVPNLAKIELPIQMASMNKCKTVEEILKWAENHNPGEKYIIMPKFDGISLVTDPKRNLVATRGDGNIGQNVTKHFELIGNKIDQPVLAEAVFYGEAIMSKSKFEKHSLEYKNPRNLVAGKFNEKVPSPILNDIDFVCYGVYDQDQRFKTKSEQIQYLNQVQPNPVEFLIVGVKDLTADFLQSKFDDWSHQYELDGLIIQIDDLHKCYDFESNSNPKFARAYKGDFEEVTTTEVTDITWQISKRGFLKPVVNVKTVHLNGTNVSNIFGDNAKFIQENKIGKGTIIKIKKSGMIIPRIMEVISGPVHDSLPKICPVCGSKTEFEPNEVELVCTFTGCEGRELQKIISFFEILEVDGVSDGVCEELYNLGFDTIQKIMNIVPGDLGHVPGWGNRRIEMILDSISDKTKSIAKEKYWHASGCFMGLGSKKLVLLKHFNTKPTIEQVCAIPGFSEISAKIFVDGWDKFWSLASTLPVTIKVEKEVEKDSNVFDSMVFVFTGFRNKEAEVEIEKNGGKIGSSVTSSTTHLIMKEKGSGSSKETKAIEKGIKIMNEQEFDLFLKLNTSKNLNF